jgi:hypothetical protein
MARVPVSREPPARAQKGKKLRYTPDTAEFEQLAHRYADSHKLMTRVGLLHRTGPSSFTALHWTSS